MDFFEKSIKNKRLAHAYLFTGPAHLGKKTVALEFVRMLTGNEIDMAIHPDILIIEPEVVETEKGVKKELEIGLEQAKKIQHEFSMFPYRSPYKIALINQAEKMTFETGNCLLKTLEEPNNKTILILIASNSEYLLPTIISRCQRINFLPVAEKDIEKGIKGLNTKAINLKRIIRLANGRPGLAIQYLENPEFLENQGKIIAQLEKLLRADINERYKYVEDMSKDIPMAQNILYYWLFWFRDLMLLDVQCSGLVIYDGLEKYNNCYSLPKLRKIIQKIKQTKSFLSNPSINAKLSLEVLMLEF